MMQREYSFPLKVCWDSRVENQNTADFTVKFPDKANISGSAADAFHGNPEFVSPEELFVSSLSACQMLTYLHLCDRHGIKVIAYKDDAKGILKRNSDGSFFMEKIIMRPVIQFGDFGTDEKRAMVVRLVHEAHHDCFLSNSIRTELVIEPNFFFELE